LAATYGSDESRGAARHIAFAYQKRMSVANVFLTISPDTASNVCILINNGNLEIEYRLNAGDELETGIKFVKASERIQPHNWDPSIFPNRDERKIMVGDNPYLSAEYSLRVFNVFVTKFLGWDKERCRSSSEGGALGRLRWYMASAEAQQCADNHFHMVCSIFGFPKTTDDLYNLMESEPAFEKRYKKL